MRIVKQGIHIIQQTIPHRNRPPARLGHRRPAESLLRNRSLDIMIAVKREERRQAHPARAQIIVRIVCKTASIRSEHGYTTHHERESLGDGEEHAAPSRCVVAAPVGRCFTGAGEGAAADCEGSLAREDGEQGVVGCVGDLVAEEVVHLVFCCVVLVAVGGVWGDGAFD